MNFNCIEQVGGFDHIDILLLEETGNWPLVVTDANSNRITITPNEVPISGAIVPDSIRVGEDHRTRDGGDLWDIDIRFSYLTQSSLMEYYLEQYKTHEVVVTVCKNINQQKLYGTDKYPLTLSYTPVNGNKPEDGMRTDIRIFGNIPVRPVYRLMPVL